MSNYPLIRISACRVYLTGFLPTKGHGVCDNVLARLKEAKGTYGDYFQLRPRRQNQPCRSSDVRPWKAQAIH